MLRFALAFGFASAVLFAAETRVQMKDLPEAVQRTVKDQTKLATLKGLSKEVEHGKVFYEAETTLDGRSRDVLIDSAGTVVEVEQQVAFESIPEAARKAIQMRARSGKIVLVESVTRGPAVSYEATIQKGGRKTEISVNADGSLRKGE